MNGGAAPSDEPNASRASDADSADDELLKRAGRGDSGALQLLLDRYDRLVRYAIFRVARRQCTRDPQLLDSIASETWTAVIQAARSPEREAPRSVKSYVVRIARNRSVSAIRTLSRQFEHERPDEGSDDRAASDEEPASTLLENMEQLELLRTCMAELAEPDRQICGQIVPISNRHWREAAEVLGMSESTLRSRWQRIEEQIRRCMVGKGGKGFAPSDRADDV